MGMTFSEKILSEKSGKSGLSSGKIVEVKPDFLLSHDNTAAISKNFQSIGVKKVRYPDKAVIVLDHCVPAATEKYATNHKVIRDFVKENNIEHFFDVGYGICHQVFAEEGFALPGNLILGSDSHTTSYGAFGAFSAGIGRTEMAVLYATGELWLKIPETMKIEVTGEFKEMVYPKDLILKIIGDIGSDGALYKAVEFCGDTIKNMSISGRIVLTNMAAEMGAKNGYVTADEKTFAFIKDKAKAEYKSVESDPDAVFSDILKYSVNDLEPMIAKPHTVDNTTPVSELKGTKIDQILIGTCTNGRLDDLKVTADILKNKKISNKIRLLIFPASQKVFIDALEQGIIKTIADAGGIIMNPGCGPCLGAHEGVLAPGESALSTANRNFKGRMGCKDAEIYLCSPATAAVSALTGVITDPREL